jgi:hypothetical protein
VNGDESRQSIFLAENVNSGVDPSGLTIWIADPYRGDGKRFVVRADEKLTAFVELQSAIRLADRTPKTDANL